MRGQRRAAAASSPNLRHRRSRRRLIASPTPGSRRSGTRGTRRAARRARCVAACTSLTRARTYVAPGISAMYHATCLRMRTNARSPPNATSARACSRAMSMRSSGVGGAMQLAGRRAARGLSEDPRVALRAARDHHRVDAGALEHRDHVACREHVAAADDRHADRRLDLRDRRPSRPRPCRTARACARGPQPPRRPRLPSRARTRRALALARRPSPSGTSPSPARGRPPPPPPRRSPRRATGSRISALPSPFATTLVTGQPMLMSMSATSSP